MSKEFIESVEFNYRFHDDEGGSNKTVNLEMRQECLHLDDVCEMFEEFIKSAGFSVDGLYRYFKHESEE